MKLPDGWIWRKLGEVSDVNDRDHRTPIYLEAGIPLISPKDFTCFDINFQNPKYVSIEEYTNFIRKCKPEIGDVLYSRIGTIGEPRLIETKEKFVALHSIAVLKPDRKKIIPKYLLYLLKTDLIKNQARRGTKSIGTPDLGLKEIKKFNIPLPPLQTQNKIVEIVEKAEETKRFRAQADELTNQLLQSVFLEMFGDPLKNPKGWEKKSIFEVCHLNPKHSELTVSKDTDVSFLPMQSITEDGRIINSEVRIISDVLNGFTYFKEGDILFAKITPCMENGKGVIAKNLKNGIGFGSTEFHVLRPKTATSEWIYYLLSLKFIRKIASKNMTGSAGQKRVPASFFEKLKVGVPPLSLQQKFTQIVEKIEVMRQIQNQSQKEIDNLFNTLMQKAFKGELTA